MTGTEEVLRSACAVVGFDAGSAELVRASENAIYRLPGGVVVRVGRPGQLRSAENEVVVARWLEANGVPAVQVLPDVDQPVEVGGRSVTFWRELPPHRHGTTVQVAAALRRLHALPPPTMFDLPPLAPFVRLAERVDGATNLPDDDRTWLRTHLAELRDRYTRLPAGRPHRVLHGDAWTGNILSTSDGRVVFADLERTAFGPPEWDLLHTAIDRHTFAGIDAEEYRRFADTYGHDVTEWDGYEVLRDIREFRMTCMAVQLATTDPAYRAQAAHRIACLRGGHGARPWGGWRAVP